MTFNTTLDPTTPPGTPGDPCPEWLVLVKRETFPVEVTQHESEVNARTFADRAGQQWSEVYVCRVLSRGAGRGFPAPGPCPRCADLVETERAEICACCNLMLVPEPALCEDCHFGYENKPGSCDRCMSRVEAESEREILE